MSSGMTCDCCLNSGASLEINFEYVHRGARENYSSMLLDCFGLKVPTDDSNGWICNGCVKFVRDAASFKRRVVSAQLTLSVRRTRVADGTLDVKVEEGDSDCSYYDFETDAYDDVDRTGEDSMKLNTLQSWSSDDDDALFVIASNKQNMSNEIDLKPQKASTMIKMKSKGTKLANVLKKRNLKTKTEKSSIIRGDKGANALKSAFIANSSAILNCSNAVPFNGRTSRGYRCFYCTRCYVHPESLREHTATEHYDEKLLKILSKFSVGNYMVYFDITNLQCKLCQRQLNSLDDLKTHLMIEHGRTTHAHYGERDIPFKITAASCECVKCNQKFETFGSLERHMNTHYRHHVCEQCGAGFITQRRLHAHTTLSHATGEYPCDCGKIFSSQIKLKLHENAVHKMHARFKCSQCSERFFDYYKRQAHLVSVHDAAPLQYKCNVCDRTFLKRSGLNRHTKRFHLQELNFACDVCAYKCFSNHELKVHMVKHTGQRVHECEVCKKAYARLKTLKEHMRIHRDDRRHVCRVCSQAFVQKCSLNGHYKTHHSTVVDDC